MLHCSISRSQVRALQGACLSLRFFRLCSCWLELELTFCSLLAQYPIYIHPRPGNRFRVMTQNQTSSHQRPYLSSVTVRVEPF
ncbi:hypothetical protein C8R42DRAFT_11897 [Lentinula raphanica]|nr:hypothetical protein C8R42DRAFT_11897 [Lentinula raphanica]